MMCDMAALEAGENTATPHKFILQSIYKFVSGRRDWVGVPTKVNVDEFSCVGVDQNVLHMAVPQTDNIAN